MNIEYLSAHYLLKRWTKEARNGTVQDSQGRNIIENPKLDALLCYRFMSRKFYNMAHRAASFPECALLVDEALDILTELVKEKMSLLELNNDSLNNVRLKKKEVRTNNSKRFKTWFDTKRKARKKRKMKTALQEKVSVVC